MSMFKNHPAASKVGCSAIRNAVPLVVLAGILLACSSAPSADNAENSTPTTTPRAVSSSPLAPPVTTTTTTKPDPYSTNGTWLVPAEIKPGTYRATYRPSPVRTKGYIQICADAACKIGTPGFIDNYNFDNNEIVFVPDNAFSVKIESATLAPIG